ncbi:B-cell receptor-associated protein 31-like [Montipora foliosa]|uniref:B-cell receptor-associated protein 31-like n=1 Tax=Montipora foliosa TaxID=591990 RepID=UPI0035F1A446
MTLQWTFAAGFLYFEIGILILFCLPFISPRRWNRIFNSRIIGTLFEYGNFYYNVFVIVMVLLLADSIRETRKYSKIDSAPQDLKNNPQAETMAQMRMFRAQRNLYISGFSLFLLVVLRRVVKLLSGYSVLEASNEASIRQAQNVSKQCEQLMAENDELKKSIEEAGGEAQRAPKDEDELNQELKELRESLEEKSKKLAERTEELEKTKLDLAALKEQATGLTREYDRLLDEHSKAQAQLEKDETQAPEDKKDN